METPCRGCGSRTINCHSDCKKYNNFKSEQERICRNRKKYLANYSLLFRRNIWHD